MTKATVDGVPIAPTRPTCNTEEQSHDHDYAYSVPISADDRADRTHSRSRIQDEAGATSLVVVEDVQSRRRIGLITEADLVEAAAESMDGTTFGSET